MSCSLKAPLGGAALLLAALTAAIPTGPARAGDGDLVASRVQFGDAGEATRFVLETSGEPAFNVFPVADPPRIVIDLDGIAFRLVGDAAPPPPAGSVVTGWRFGEIAPGRARIVLDARGPALPAAAFFLPAVGDAPGRLVVDLAAADEAAFAAAVERARGAASRTGRPRALAERSGEAGDAPLVVVDPGHGGIDPGAVGPDGTFEKDLTLAFSLTLAEILAERAGIEVALTRGDDRFLSLSQRVALARNAGADLFVSIHADAAPQAFVRGATVYTLSERPSDAEAAQMAARENAADVIAGLPMERASDAVTDIFVDLVRRETRVFSRRFADLLLDSLAGTVRLINNPHRSARFRVLMAHDVPSVLVEIGYLSNERDAALMVQPEWRRRTAEAVADAVARYFTGLSPTAAGARAGLPGAVERR